MKNYLGERSKYVTNQMGGSPKPEDRFTMLIIENYISKSNNKTFEVKKTNELTCLSVLLHLQNDDQLSA